MPRNKKWVIRKYEILKEHFNYNGFDSSEAAKVLKELGEISDEKSINVILDELKKENLVEVLEHPTDKRKVIYRLRPLFYLGREITKDELIRLLKKAADIIRNRVSYEFILVLLFYKRLSDKWKERVEEVKRDLMKKYELSEEEAEKDAKKKEYHEGLEFSEELLWDEVTKDTEKLPEKLANAFKELSKRNPELSNILERIDFMTFASNIENKEILRQLVDVFSGIRLGKVSEDLLGDAYEWIISYFAPTKAKEGEVYTPREVIKLMVKIVEPKNGEKIYDPALGSGGMLIYSYLYLKEIDEKAAKSLSLYGQEVNSLTLAIAKMNLIIHEIKANVELGDSLLKPRFLEEYGSFDIVLTNIPWNQYGYDEKVLKSSDIWNKRFVFGFPPRQSADWAWLQHIVFSLNEKTGRAAVVVDNGCLFRGGKEKNIREKFIENDFVECVILLPEKLFYNVAAPGSIIILRRNKPEQRKGKILFINASQEYEKHPEIRRLNRLNDKHIEKIVNAYKEFKDIPGFSKVVSLDEIRKNDYNLNVTMYVFPEEKEEEIDVKKGWEELNMIEDELKKINEKISSFIYNIPK